MKTVTVHLTDQAYEALEAVSYAEALSFTDAINRALIAYSALSAHRKGEKVTLKNADGSAWRTVAVITAGGAS